MKKGSLHLIPNILAEGRTAFIPAYIKDVVSRITIFGVEEIRSARRLLKGLNKDIVIDDLEFHFINEHENASLPKLIQHLKNGQDVGYISEAGCPAVADPGQELVAMAHALDIPVIPHVGPNSILLALMASGFNGQHFQFLGYLPIKQPERSTRIKEIERESRDKQCTQLFIETPYRNNQLLEELVKQCHPNTQLCIACNLTADDEHIVSKPISWWKSNTLSFHKKPAIFLLMSSS